jgi:phosphoribosylformylglycinamidine (FGAM) synthase-like enzyme
VIGCVGLVEDVRRIPSRWAAGDVVLLASAAEPGELAAEVELIRFLWRSAPLLSLAHDVSDGGVELALDEAARWSGVEARVAVPEEPIGGAAILACRPELVAELRWPALVRIGEVPG